MCRKLHGFVGLDKSFGATGRVMSRIDVEKSGGLKGSMQHWLAVYPPEFQIPMFFVAVD